MSKSFVWAPSNNTAVEHYFEIAEIGLGDIFGQVISIFQSSAGCIPRILLMMAKAYSRKHKLLLLGHEYFPY